MSKSDLIYLCTVQEALETVLTEELLWELLVTCSEKMMSKNGPYGSNSYQRESGSSKNRHALLDGMYVLEAYLSL